MARPKKKASDKLTSRLPHIRCTGGDLTTIQEKAKRASMSVSDYVRHMALTGNVKVEEPIIDFETLTQIKRIGVNLNQLTKVANSTGELPEELRHVYWKVETVLDHIIEKL